MRRFMLKMTRGLLISFILFVLSFSDVYALMELSGTFSYDRTIFGVARQNKQIDRTWAGTIAFFLFNYTAIELNYTYNDEITTINEVIPIPGYTLSQVSSQGKVNNEVFGIGLRQVFAGRKARLRPSLSLGYAKQFMRSESNTTYEDTSSGTLFLAKGNPSKGRVDSAFATFSLQLRLTGRVSLKCSVNTLFKASDLNAAKDNLKYSIGFSWFL